jgi:hypothetical protein
MFAVPAGGGIKKHSPDNRLAVPGMDTSEWIEKTADEQGSKGKGVKSQLSAPGDFLNATSRDGQ